MCNKVVKSVAGGAESTPNGDLRGDQLAHGLVPGPAQRQRVERTIDYMVQHLTEPVTVSRLSSVVGVSASHFFWLFKSVTGCSPIYFFMRLRMQRACELLEATNLNVKEVASFLGYDDPFYFSRVFKSVIGIAPRHYRNAKTTGPNADVHERFPAFSPFAHVNSDWSGMSVRADSISMDQTNMAAISGTMETFLGEKHQPKSRARF
jgi:AraC-like DNA-binding protein